MTALYIIAGAALALVAFFAIPVIQWELARIGHAMRTGRWGL